MENLGDFGALAEAMLAQRTFLEPLLIAGVGVFVFLISEQGMREFNAFNGLFVILGLLIGLILTAMGLYQAYEAYSGLDPNAFTPAAPADAPEAPAAQTGDG